jgi:hypothetical protein
MNTQALIPLGATIAYIPLFVVLLANRPWQSQQRSFFLFLIPAIFWSISDVFFRSDWFMPYKLILVKAVLCGGIWMVIQYRYLLQSFYKSQVAKMPFAYFVLAASVALSALGYIPKSVTVAADGIAVDYGIWLLLIAFIIFIITGKDFLQLIRKLRVSDNAVERNQIIYLLMGLASLAIFGLATAAFSALGEYPIAHIGNFLNACVLTYAVVTHRLADVRVVLRRLLISVVLYGGGLAILLLLFWAFYLSLGFELNVASLAATIGLGIPAILFFVRRMRDPWGTKIEEAFEGVRYSSR